MNYDVPREPGFYWCQDDGGEPYVARWDFDVEQLKRHLCNGTEEPFWFLYSSWSCCGSDEDQPPEHVLCRCEMPRTDTLPELYRRMALIAKGMSHGARIDMDGHYLTVRLRNPKPPRAKAAPKKASSRARPPRR